MIDNKLAVAGRLEQLSWDDCRLFVALSEQGSLRKSAKRAGVSVPTIMRRVEQLEAALGARLVNRSPDGISLTLFGQSVRAIVEKMRAPILELERFTTEQRSDRIFISVTVTQGLGANWLIPNARSFDERHPLIGLAFRITNELADVTRFDSDLAIQMTPPEAPDVVAIKLGRMHFELFASPDYLARYGWPSTLEALRGHRFVEQFDGHVDQGHLANLVPGIRKSQIAAMVRGSAGAISAIECGLGIGSLPNYSIAIGNKVEALGLPARAHRDIWLTYNRDLRGTPGLAEVVDWLKGTFASGKWPCFRDDHVSAKDVPPMRIRI